MVGLVLYFRDSDGFRVRQLTDTLYVSDFTRCFPEKATMLMLLEIRSVLTPPCVGAGVGAGIGARAFCCSVKEAFSRFETGLLSAEYRKQLNSKTITFLSRVATCLE